MRIRGHLINMRKAWSSSSVLPLVVVAVGAVVAAVLKQVISILANSDWDWKELFQNIVENAFIAVLLAFILTRIAKYQELLLLKRTQSTYVLGRLEVIALAVSGWNTIPATPLQPLTERPEEPDVLESLRQAAKEWRESGTELEEIYARKELLDGSYYEIDAYRSMQLLRTAQYSIQIYMKEGGRTRRLIWLRWLADDLAKIEDSPDFLLAAHSRTCRRAATELHAWIQHTDATIVERLVVNRSPSAQRPQMQNYEKLIGDRGYHIDQAAISFDYMHVMLDFIRTAHRELDRAPKDVRLDYSNQMMDVVQRCIGALRNELFAAVELSEALQALVERARQVGSNQ